MMKTRLSIYRLGGMLTLDVRIRLIRLCSIKFLIPIPLV